MKLDMDYIYMIHTKSGAYVGNSRWPVQRANQHQYDRYVYGKQYEFHKEMREHPYTVYVLDVRLGVCGTELEKLWIAAVSKICADNGINCWNTNGVNCSVDWGYIEERWDHKQVVLTKR